MMFADRIQAGQLLAEKLAAYQGAPVIILALPRGGVVLGYEVAKKLEAPLDIIAVRKVGHPSFPEYAIGAVDERGTLLLNQSEAAHIDKEWLRGEIAREKKEATRRAKAYRGSKPAAKYKNKVAIIVDDGIATGLTMEFAVTSVLEQAPEKVIVAVPVAPHEALNKLMRLGAEIVVLAPPEEFAGAVGAHYINFSQVSDEEVIRLLHTVHTRDA